MNSVLKRIMYLCMLLGICSPSSGNATFFRDVTEFPGDPRALAVRAPEVVNGSFGCHLHPHDENLPSTIDRKIESGAKLIKYDVQFPEYDEYDIDPLDLNASVVFKPHSWQRVVGEHGKTLLSLAFNYDILSLQMLTFGVEQMTVDVIDEPPGCFQQQNDSRKQEIIRHLLLNDFRVHAEKSEHFSEDDYICQQLVIEDDNGYGDVQYECCTINEDGDGEIVCTQEIEDAWINLLYILIFGLKVGFLLLGPLVIQKWIYHRSIRKATYTIKLHDVLRKTLVVKKIRTQYEEDSNVVEPGKDYPRQFDKFKKIVKALPSEEVVPVNISRLHVQVDHKELMDEKSVPTGLLYYIWSNFFQCGLRRYEPFLSCCRESIVGSWDTRFLWLKLFSHGSDCNKSCRKYLSWGHITRMIGFFILVGAVATPFALRIAIFYLYEEPEIEARKEAIASLGLDERIGSNIFHYLTPAHIGLISMYVAFFSSFIILALYQAYETDTFEEIVLGSLQDLRSISRSECARLLLAHLLLPFEKFGLCGGVLVACIYYVFAVPLCVITIIWYCLPTFYLTGRLTIQSRPRFVKYSAVPYVPKHAPTSSPTRAKKSKWAIDSLSLGITSFESCMMLNNISPNTRDDRPPHEFMSDPCGSKCTSHVCWTEFTKVIIGIICVIWMYCVLLMYAECFGFIVEGFVMILMGAVVNAGSAANYIMVSFWAITYSVSCYNDAYEKYLNLNSKIFEYIKAKLNDDIKKVTSLREQKQRYTAFKYFSREEMQKERQDEIEVDLESEDELKAVLGTSPERVDIKPSETYEDSIEYIEGKLQWHIHHLVLFVDRKDVPRIPRELFDQVCHIQAPGCPGPVYRGLLKATQNFLYMVVFLVFVAIVVMAFGSMYDVSSTNQLLVTLAGGFVPFVIRFVLQPKRNDLNLNTYTFEGKVHEIIKSFTQTWAVHDLTFTLDSNVEQDIPASNLSDGGGTGNQNGGGTVITQPTSRQVDLLITIKDDPTEEPTGNLRSEPGSLGSITSGGNRVSPENALPPIRTQPSQNNPTNATSNPLLFHHSRSLEQGSGTGSPSEEIQLKMIKDSKGPAPENITSNLDKKDLEVKSNPSSRRSSHDVTSLKERAATSPPPEAAVQIMVDVDKYGETQVRSVAPEKSRDSSEEESEELIRSPSRRKQSAKNSQERVNML